MAHYSTKYEITARHPDGTTYLVAYTPRLTRRGLLVAMCGAGPEIVEKTSMGKDDEFIFAKSPRWHATMNAWTIGFTGRTLHDIEHGGETAHQFIAA